MLSLCGVSALKIVHVTLMWCSTWGQSACFVFSPDSLDSPVITSNRQSSYKSFRSEAFGAFWLFRNQEMAID